MCLTVRRIFSKTVGSNNLLGGFRFYFRFCLFCVVILLGTHKDCMIQMRLTVRRIFQKLSFPISFLEVLALSANSAVYFDFSEDRE